MTYEEAESFAKKIEAEYIETYALNNDDLNVTNAFKKIAESTFHKISEMFKDISSFEDFSGTIKKKTHCCCNII